MFFRYIFFNKLRCSKVFASMSYKGRMSRFIEMNMDLKFLVMHIHDEQKFYKEHWN